jgi:hypothetical protein
MAIVPDTKDWTWVLTETCPDCGFAAASVDRADVGRLLRENIAAWRPLLDHPLAGVRPDDATWSAVEYACHVRDVFRLFDQRLGWMLDQDDPTFANWDQDVTAIEDDYASQSAGPVLDALEADGEVLAAHFDAVSGDQWERTASRSDGARFTVASFASYLLHDPTHHVWDVTQGYERAPSGPGR